MGNIWREQLIQNQDLSKSKKLVLDVKQRMKDISSQNITNELTENPSKLNFLAMYKNEHKFEKYLQMHNFEHRRAITKLRTSSHKLGIETGRWNNIQRENRICENCLYNNVDDEHHFLFECHMHIAERTELFETLQNKTNIDISHPEHQEEISKKMFSTDDLASLNAIGKFICNAFKKRENTTFYTQPCQFIFYQDTQQK